MKLELRAEEIKAIEELATEKARKLVETLNSSVFMEYASSEAQFDITKEIAFYECVAHKMESALMNFNNL